MVTGRRAEEAAAHFLMRHGCQVVAQNWRTRWCEIDIVARKDSLLCFVEVKYRASLAWGDGLAYITPAKQRQMRFAAEVWLARQPWHGEVCLLAVAVTGPSFVVTKVVRFDN